MAMEPLVICAVATGGLVGLFFVVLAWVMLTGVAPKRLKRFLVRYCVRGVCLRTHNTLPWDESSVTCVVDEQVYMGMIPKQPEQLAALRKDQRVSALVTLNEVWEMPFYLAIAGIDHSEALPSKDCLAVTLDTTRTFISTERLTSHALKSHNCTCKRR